MAFRDDNDALAHVRSLRAYVDEDQDGQDEDQGCLDSILSQAVLARGPMQVTEPSIQCEFEEKHVRVPPAHITSVTNLWNGRLYVGSLSAAISESWLRWAAVTHVVCVLGQYAGANDLATEWVVAFNNRLRGIKYLDWPINISTQCNYWRVVFAQMSDALDSAADAVLVHCRNGKDRSCFAVYASLRLVHHMDHQTALRHVSQRVDRYGYPVFDGVRCVLLPELMEWVHANLGTPMEAESGV